MTATKSLREDVCIDAIMLEIVICFLPLSHSLFTWVSFLLLLLQTHTQTLTDTLKFARGEKLSSSLLAINEKERERG